MDVADFKAAFERIAASLQLKVWHPTESHVVVARDRSRLTFSLEFTETGVFAYAYFRTTSWDWDGERTDLNDLLSVLPAISLRIEPPFISSLLYDVEHPLGLFVDGNPMPESEVYARYIAFSQPEGLFSVSADSLKRIGEILTALAAYETNVAGLVAMERGVSDRFSYKDEALLRWVRKVRAALGQSEDAEASYNVRTNPRWMFYRSKAVGASVYYSPLTASALGRLVEQAPPWAQIDGPTVRFFRSEFAHNAARHPDIERCRHVLTQLEGTSDGMGLIPLENRLVALGREHVVMLEVECDRAVYNDGRNDVVARQRQEHDVLFDGRIYEWAPNIDGGRFEEFTRDLLSRRPGVVHVRQTSVANEGDAGADLLCTWDVMSLADVKQPDQSIPMERRTIVVQCKAWGRPVGKHDVTDIRDTLERYDASGILVVAPAVRRSLFEHLLALRKHNVWADFWDRGELEEQLDAHPDLVRKYQDVVRYAAPST